MFSLHNDVINIDENRIQKYKSHYKLNNYVQLPNVFSDQTIQIIHDKVLNTHYKEFQHDQLDSAYEDVFQDHLFYMGLELALNQQSFLKLISHITDAPSLTCFTGGRIYKFAPNSRHACSWHSDADNNRIVGMSVNLSPVPYEGGHLQIKSVDDDSDPPGIDNTSTGSAVLFKIDPNLVHRVNPLKGRNSRIALAGWFRSQPHSYFEYLQNKRNTKQREL